MIVDQLENCCSVIEVGNFNNNDTKTTLKEAICLYLLNNDYDLNYVEVTEPPQVFMATTIEKQVVAIDLLKSVGFRKLKVVPSRHIGKTVTIWIKIGYRKLLTKREWDKFKEKYNDYFF